MFYSLQQYVHRKQKKHYFLPARRVASIYFSACFVGFVSCYNPHLAALAARFCGCRANRQEKKNYIQNVYEFIYGSRNWDANEVVSRARGDTFMGCPAHRLVFILFCFFRGPRRHNRAIITFLAGARKENASRYSLVYEK